MLCTSCGFVEQQVVMMEYLCHVAINLLSGIRVVGTLEVIPGKQVLDTLLHQRNVGSETARQDVDGLGDEQVVC